MNIHEQIATDALQLCDTYVEHCRDARAKRQQIVADIGKLMLSAQSLDDSGHLSYYHRFQSLLAEVVALGNKHRVYEEIGQCQCDKEAT